ncbi:MAG: ketoacyl-ACP synthase III [Paenibacillus dendritiformis]|uniref:3-oxoacyl-ACP synthase III family protein n=1 Tax=Paenibacillus dendritiformis TaxID=130049 RepID=UPI001B050116|nr:ketoacyl-ACP synthase III [Paenibacillus dendritiformis]MDU5141900.1 ketoacyl-ACP synthase III [Paenibacillus dendritiformis]GIO76113.1 3-oxoacyl-ACP synthase [Paenibacillus dendritiformis]
MLLSKFNNLQIAGIACATPTQEVTAEELYEKFGKDVVEKTIKMVGVKRSRQSTRKQLSSDLGYVAARAILQTKQIDPSSIGVLLYVTQTPDYRVPATASILHQRLGLTVDCAAMDINLGCSGFIYGVHSACSLLTSLNCERALCIVGDTSSKLGSQEDRVSSLLFGDGTAAILIEKSVQARSIEIALRSDGSRYDAIMIPNGAFRAMTLTPEELALGHRSYAYPIMKGTDVFNFSITDIPKHIHEFLLGQNKSISDYDCLALHQANLFMLQQIAKRVKASPEQLLVSIDRYGNTSGASIPLSLVDRYGAQDRGEIQALMSGFGVGLSWGVMSASLLAENILPMIYTDEFYDDPALNVQE